MLKRIRTGEGIVVARPESEACGYYAWPTVARSECGTLWVAASGMRNGHMSPLGMTVLFRSEDEGLTWSPPVIVNNSTIDDRDAGLLALPGNRLMLNWFSIDSRQFEYLRNHAAKRLDFRPMMNDWDDAVAAREKGSFVRVMEADGTWSGKRRVPVSSPHGPLRLADGGILYLGTMMKDDGEFDRDRGVGAYVTHDEGKNWTLLGNVPTPEKPFFHCEPYAIELAPGYLLGMIRYQSKNRVNSGDFAILRTFSADGGRTWSEPEEMIKGSPPHLLRHSSGVLICSYAWRYFPYGERVVFSVDNGASWSEPWILRDDGVSDDLGYPSTVELHDGTLFTVYYQRISADNENCALYSSRWRLPDEISGSVIK